MGGYFIADFAEGELSFHMIGSKQVIVGPNIRLSLIIKLLLLFPTAVFEIKTF